MHSRIDEIQRRLALLAVEKIELEAELVRLRKFADTSPLESEKERIDLFLSFFRCRETVFARLWERPEKGIKGYSPVCDNEWVRGICGKPPNGKVKCSECPNQAFRRLDDRAVKAHLDGQSTIGSYAIREDDTCVFLACDFDGAGWLDDALLYQSVAREMGIEVLIERSRSGNGAHAWMFFCAPIQARLARTLGTLILAKCCELNCRLGLESYDRFFPNQDCIPRGGFGNLIALPLQGRSVEFGNTMFVDANGVPFADQWALLSQVSRLALSDVESLIQRFLRRPSLATTDDASLATDTEVLELNGDIKGSLPSGFSIEVTVSAQVQVPLIELPSRLVASLKRLASFPNPEFYKLQRMRMQTYPHPRFIFAGELRPDALLLPRGLQERVIKTLEIAGATIHLTDVRISGTPIEVSFTGTLTNQQDKAVKTLHAFQNGVLVALPGAGKTVMACALIAELKVSTLILLHKQPLVEQWKEKLGTFLGIVPKEIGIFSGTKKKRTGQIDIAMLQTLTNAPDSEVILGQYGLVIVDECHHVPATSFEAVMKQCPSRSVWGLTATPKRKDGLEKLLYLQCGPIRHEIKVAGDGIAKRVHIHETGIRLPEDFGLRTPYHVIAQFLSTNEDRNALIGVDLLATVLGGRFPLVLSDRKEQIEALRAALTGQLVQGFLLDGSLSAKKRRAVLEELLAARSEGLPTCLFATASLIGEGFDLPELDTLFLTMPLSFEGRLVQYVGRLNRVAAGKTDILVHDYVDSHCAVSQKMYRSRLTTYKKMGFAIDGPKSLFGRVDVSQANLFDQ